MLFKSKKEKPEEDFTLSELKAEKYKKERKEEKVALTRDELKRRLKYGSLSTVLTAVFIVAVILVNIIVNLVAEKIPDIDTSAQQYYELSEDSIEYLKSLKDYDISISFIGDKITLMQDSYYDKILRVAEKYKLYNDRITVQCVDTAKNPTYVSKYEGVELTDGDVIIACGDRYRHLTSGDLLVSDKDENSQTSTSDSADTSVTYTLNAEYALTTGIMVVTASDHPKATVINGHGEAEIEVLNKLLVNNGYEVNSQSIIKELDQSANVLIIAAPTKDYTEEELKKLDEFLYNGGKYERNILYVADYTQPALPNLEAFLGDWGFEIGTGVVYESDSSIAFASAPFLTKLSFIDTDLTLSLALSEVSALDLCARPVKIKDTLDIHSKNSVVLQHSDTTKLGSIDENGNFVVGDSQAYPYAAMAYTTSTVSDGNGDVHSSNVIVVDSLGYFGEDLFGKSYANSDVTIATVDYALGREARLTLPTKSLTEASSNITQKQADTIGFITAVIIPFVLLVLCLFIYIRRRFL